MLKINLTQIHSLDSSGGNFIGTVPSINLFAQMIVPIIIGVTAFLIFSCMFVKWINSLRNKRGKIEENKNDRNEGFVKKEEFVLPDWLMNRREMIFPETSVIKGQQLGRGQFGIVQKGELVQGYAKYVKIYKNCIIQ